MTDLIIEGVKKETNIVVKRNELIYSQHNLSATAQKMMAALLSLVDSRSKSLPKFEFTISELAELLGVSYQNVHKQIDSVTDELQQQFVTVPIVVPEKGEDYSVKKHGFSKFNWFKTCQYFPHTKKAVFIFHEDIEKYVIDITSDFTKYQFIAIKQLGSKYAIRLYELLRRHYTIAEAEKGTSERFVTISIIELKAMLSLGDKYSLYSKFENRVLKVAQKELLEKTDITFTYRALERKTPNSRAPVKNILFTIRANKKTKPIPSLSDNRPVFEQLRDFLSIEAASRVCGKYTDLFVTDNLLYVYNTIATGTVINDQAKFFHYCLKFDMANNASALNPATYDDENQKDFIRVVVMSKWAQITDEVKDELREYGLTKGFLADVFAYWKLNIDEANIDDLVWDKLSASEQLSLI